MREPTTENKRPHERGVEGRKRQNKLQVLVFPTFLILHRSQDRWDPLHQSRTTADVDKESPLTPPKGVLVKSEDLL